MKIKYDYKWKKDNKSFLFLIDLNKKFIIKENENAICDSNGYGINFGSSELVLFNKGNEYYSNFGDMY